MTKLLLVGAALPMALALSSCDREIVAETAETAAEEEAAGAATPAPAIDCPVVESRNWAAWVEPPADGMGAGTLRLTGELDLPTPGYEMTVELGIADRSAVPMQQVKISFAAPEGMVTQVITPMAVDFSGAASARQYSSIRVMCAGRMLAEISPVGPRQ